MGATYTNPRYPFRRPPALDRPGAAEQTPIVITGAGLVGLTLALDLAKHGIASVVLDDDDTVSFGSRAICFAKRTIEILDRLGLGDAMLAKGVTWKQGRVFHRDREAYAFDLLPEDGHRAPAFLNLQQYYVEEWLVAACEATGLVDLRWRSRVSAVEPHADGALIQVATPEGDYAIDAGWLLACDGARSFVRESLRLPFTGQVFRDRFLIADVVLSGETRFPSERWFWFDPPFHPNQSVLLHRQPDEVWRIDFQLGWDADPEAEKDPARVRARVQAMLGPEARFELEWISVYTFRCRRLERFVHDRIIFVGDSAHQVSPFGARGGNGGVQDADNLAWKLAYHHKGLAPRALVESYDAERVPAADENILHSTRATDFITPKSEGARLLRDAVLELAVAHPFARTLVNSGRLSQPAAYHASPLTTASPDTPGLGAAVTDAPLGNGWLLQHLGFNFALVVECTAPPAATVARLAGLRVPCRVIVLQRDDQGSTPPGATLLNDPTGLAAQRNRLGPGEAMLVRPDQHVAARFASLDEALVRSALDRAYGAAPADNRAKVPA